MADLCLYLWKSKIDATLELSRCIGFAGDDSGGKHSRCDALRLDVVRVYELLEFRVQEIRAELEMLHFLEGLLSCPFVMSHAIGGRHDTSAVPATSAVHIDRLIRGIVHQLQE